MARLVAVALFLAPVSAVVLNAFKNVTALNGQHVEVSSYFHSQDCFQKRPIRRSHRHGGRSFVEVSQARKIPGAGIGEITPFETVLKDGYMKVACIKDMMYHHGDKYGNNKFGYKLGEIANVSIVHYDAEVPKEDREAMTPKVCFDFCRTVPDMLVFGITNGRNCYCAPYFKQVAGDSSDCDEACDGDKSQICGGKAKSNIFEMHMCNSAAKDLKKAANATMSLRSELHWAQDMLFKIAADGQVASENLQTLYGKIGDVTAAGLFQEAKIEAGRLLELATKGNDMAVKINETDQQVADMEGADATSFDKVKEIEHTTALLQELTTEGKAVLKELNDVLAMHTFFQTKEGQARLRNVSQLYFPAMYFVDKVYLTDQSTCAGDMSAEPLFNADPDECAYACQTQPGECQAFSHYDEGKGVCFLFKNLKKLTHYSDCLGRSKKNKPAFLQRNAMTSDRTFEESERVELQPVPFTWKVKNVDGDPDAYLDAVQGLCTMCKDCGALTPNATLSDCSLMDTYKCKSVSKKDIEELEVDGTAVIRMSFQAWLDSGPRSSSCKVNPVPCDQCKLYSTCSGPYVESDPVQIKKGDVARYSWRSSGKVDNYEVFVGLYSAKSGLVDYQFQRGKQQEWKTFELMSPDTDEYWLIARLASYDGSGGGAVGADMEIKDVFMDKSSMARSATTALCVVKFAKYEGTSIVPDPSGKSPGALEQVTKRCLRSGGALQAM